MVLMAIILVLLGVVVLWVVVDVRRHDEIDPRAETTTVVRVEYRGGPWDGVATAAPPSWLLRKEITADGTGGGAGRSAVYVTGCYRLRRDQLYDVATLARATVVRAKASGIDLLGMTRDQRPCIYDWWPEVGR